MCRGNRKRDVATMGTYSHASTPLGQSECAYYLSYFIKRNDESNILTKTYLRPSDLRKICKENWVGWGGSLKKITVQGGGGGGATHPYV